MEILQDGYLTLLWSIFMGNYHKKGFFDFVFSVIITLFTIVLIVGQIIFLAVGLTIGIADWGVEGALAIGFGAFGPAVVIASSLTLFGAWRYWAYDTYGVTNGNLFFKRRFLFCNIDSIEIKTIAIGAKPFTIAQEDICFHIANKTVSVPTYCLSSEELEWLKNQCKPKNNL